MLNYIEKEKLKTFVSDEIMSNTVKDILLKSFLKDKGTKDVQVLAAERLAINLLEDGFKDIKENADLKSREEEKEKTNIAL